MGLKLVACELDHIPFSGDPSPAYFIEWKSMAATYLKVEERLLVLRGRHYCGNDKLCVRDMFTNELFVIEVDDFVENASPLMLTEMEVLAWAASL